MRLSALKERLRLQMWVIPALFGLAAIVLGVIMVAVDRSVDLPAADIPYLFGGGAEGARSMLSTIAAAMLTFTGLVFTVTMLVLQQASSQHSPRVLRTFLRDRGNQIVLGLFVATFLYTLMVLRQVRSLSGDTELFVPGLSVTLAFFLLVASVGAFVLYIDHMANAIRATTILDNIAGEARGAIDKLFPEPVGEPVEEDPATLRPDAEPAATVDCKRSGVITAVDANRLVAAASAITGDDGASRGDGRFVEMVPLVGDHVTERSVLFRAWGTWSERELNALRNSVDTGSERTVQQDAAFGLRQLVDIALRALSPSMNDPTTAVQALDRIHEMLELLLQREMPPMIRRDEAGTARLMLPRPGWDDYVLLATEEIRLAGQQQLQVMRRLRQMILALLDGAASARQPALRRQLHLIESSAARSLGDELDQRVGASADERTTSTLPK